MTKSFRFTRHILSCNNIDEGKYIIGEDNNPGLAISGITDTINFVLDKTQDKNKFKSYDVCVSNLYRTWCTAVILYGTNFEQKYILNLWICPYLKECSKKYGSINRGNYPESISHMANKFLKFLILLKILNKGIHKSSEKNHLYNEWFDTLPVDDNWYNNLPNEIILRFPIDIPSKYSKYTHVDNNIIYKKNKKGDYEILKNCVKNDYINKSKNGEYLENGNLKKFMVWFNKDPIFNSNLVHVVTHSGIMNDYLKTLGIHVKKIEQNVSDNISFIGKSNCWTFVTNTMIKCSKKINGKTKKYIIENLEYEQKNENIAENINLIKSLEIGVIENPNAKVIEQIFKKGKLSLCGETGSVKKGVRKTPLKCLNGMEGGRRRTKKSKNKI